LKDNSVTASVVITTKNRREDLLKAVESVMAQRGLLEVVVIDDGSTDGMTILKRIKTRMACSGE